jgi:hypothetical protein
VYRGRDREHELVARAIPQILHATLLVKDYKVGGIKKVKCRGVAHGCVSVVKISIVARNRSVEVIWQDGSLESVSREATNVIFIGWLLTYLFTHATVPLKPQSWTIGLVTPDGRTWPNTLVADRSEKKRASFIVKVSAGVGCWDGLLYSSLEAEGRYRPFIVFGQRAFPPSKP